MSQLGLLSGQAATARTDSAPFGLGKGPPKGLQKDLVPLNKKPHSFQLLVCAVSNFLPPEKYLPCFVQKSSPKRYCTSLTLSPKHNPPMHTSAPFVASNCNPKYSFVNCLSGNQTKCFECLSLYSVPNISAYISRCVVKVPLFNSLKGAFFSSNRCISKYCKSN